MEQNENHMYRQQCGAKDNNLSWLCCHSKKIHCRVKLILVFVKRTLKVGAS